MKQPTIKPVALVKTHRSRKTLWVGTIPELAEAFSYTLECGHSYNHAIRLAKDIKSLKSLLSNLRKAVHETQGCCFDQDYHEDGMSFLTDEVKAAYVAQQETYKGTYTQTLEA